MLPAGVSLNMLKVILNPLAVTDLSVVKRASMLVSRRHRADPLFLFQKCLLSCTYVCMYFYDSMS